MHACALECVLGSLKSSDVYTCVFFSSSSSNPSYPGPISGSSQQTTHLFSQHRLLGKECPWIFSSANAPSSKEKNELIAGFHIFKEKKMFRLGGIILIKEIWFAEKKMNGKKNFPFLCWQETLKENSGVNEIICI